MTTTRFRHRRRSAPLALVPVLMAPLSCSIEHHGSSGPSAPSASARPESSIDLAALARELPSEWLPKSPDSWSEVDRAKVLKWLHEKLLGKQVAGTYEVSGTTVTIPHPGQLEWQIEFMTPGIPEEGFKTSRVVFYPEYAMNFRTRDETLVRRLEDFGLAANQTSDGNYPGVQYTGIVTGIEAGCYWMDNRGPADVYVTLTMDVKSVDVATPR
jgi:hypothetical protein